MCVCVPVRVVGGVGDCECLPSFLDRGVGVGGGGVRVYVCGSRYALTACKQGLNSQIEQQTGAFSMASKWHSADWWVCGWGVRRKEGRGEGARTTPQWVSGGAYWGK